MSLIMPGAFGTAVHNDFKNVQSSMSRITVRANRRRQERQALYKARMKALSLPKDVQDYQRENPKGHGLPRSYQIEFKDTIPGEDATPMQNSKIVFGQFGNSAGGVQINNHAIDPKDIKFDPVLQTVTFHGPAKSPEGDVIDDVAGHFSFASPVPSGLLRVKAAAFNANLQPDPLKFNCQVSANAGAAYSSGTAKLTWDTSKLEWKNAKWENTMEFWYDTASINDPILGSLSYVENYFVDKINPNAPVQWSLTQDMFSSVYTSKMDGQVKPGQGALLTTNITNPDMIPAVPKKRSADPVKSVFPTQCQFQFSNVGNSFVGAFKTKDGSVYAIKGQVMLPGLELLTTLDPTTARGIVPVLPVKDIGINAAARVLPHAVTAAPSPPSGDDALIAQAAVPAVAPKIAAAAPAPVVRTAAAAPFTGLKPGLSILNLLTANPMVEDSSDPSGFRDTVAQVSMQDFHDIIVYYMDTDLRNTFVQSTPKVLSAGVLAIATDDPANSAFYKKLQTPYLASYLANTTMPEAKNVNGARADKMLKELPVDDPVYKRHSEKLYRMRFVEKFPQVKSFLDDQRAKDYSAYIDYIGGIMKQSIASGTTGFDSINPTYASNLAKAQSDIDSLATWAKQKRLVYAFMLLYYTQASSLPMWYSTYTGGTGGSSIGMTLKQYNGLFGTLEDNQINLSGPNFMKAFNDSVAVFNMGTIIPQLIDLDRNSSDFDTLAKACLEEFWNHYKDSPVSDLVAQANTAKQLAQDNKLRNQFFLPLVEVQRLAGANATWLTLYGMWNTRVNNATWFKVLQGGSKMFAIMGLVAVATMVMLPLMYNMSPGDLAKKDPVQFSQWVISLVRLTVQVSVWVAQGIINVGSAWSQFSGKINTLKVFFGSDLNGLLLPASQRVQSGIARYFVRTSEEIAADVSAGAGGNYSFAQRLLGRNIGELLGNIFGIVMSIVTIVMTAIDIARTTNKYMIASDAFMMCSAIVQILAIAAGWIAAAIVEVAGGVAALSAGAATAVSCLGLVASWGGPVGIALALIGIIFFILFEVFESKKPDNPVQDFVDTQCKAAGLYMDFTAVDYFLDIPAKDTSAELIGVSIKTPGNVGEPTKYIYLNDTIATPNASVEDALKYASEDVWSINTDGFGNTTFTARQYDANGGATVWYLATSDDNNSIVTRTLPAKSDASYAKNLVHCQWKVNPVEEPKLFATKSADPKQPAPKEPQSARCTIKQGDKSLALDLDTNKKPTAKGLIITSGTVVQGTWLLEMQPIAPNTLTYSHSPWTMVTSDMNMNNYPMFTPSTVSLGMTWKVDPKLPAPFELVDTKGATDEGVIRTKQDAAFSGTIAYKEYTVTATMAVGSQTVARTTVVGIRVDLASS